MRWLSTHLHNPGTSRVVLLLALWLVALALVALPAARAGDRDGTALFGGETLGIAYSGFREGQHPDRGQGAVNPSPAEVAEDLELLVAHGFRLIRLYDAGENSAQVLQLIRERDLPLAVLLGAWLKAEISNHEGCDWLDQPIPEAMLAANRDTNAREIRRVIELANRYPGIVVAVNVGNEALVDWNDHMVSVDAVIAYVRMVKAAIEQPVTVADNYAWWARSGAALAREVDFIGLHSYPVWVGEGIETGLERTIADVEAVRAALPGKPLALLEAGWPSQATEFGERASEAAQARYVGEIGDWAAKSGVPVVLFEAFDEPWKGNPDAPGGAEKHWGLFDVERRPKPVLQGQPITLYDVNAVALAVNVGGPAHRGADGIAFRADSLVNGGSAATMGDLRGAQDGAVFRSYREGALTLDAPLPAGRYDVTLMFAEPEDIPAGSRIFDVLLQGETAIEGLDVRRARDGRSRSALTRTVTGVEVAEDGLRLELRPQKGQPLLNGVVIRERLADPRTWAPVWGDEFDYFGAPDPQKWTIEEWDARRVNNEDQAYTARRSNVRVEDGRLVLEAHRERHGNAHYTSGRIHSSGKGDLHYGRVDIRARLPGGQGTWPALWMLPSDPFRYATTCSSQSDWQGLKGCDAWPNSGEIDIMEHVGYDMYRLHGTVHTRAYYWKNFEQRKGSVEVRDLERAFHVYSLDWGPDYLHIYYDGVPYFSYFNDGEGWESWPFDHPYHVILNLAIGGDWGRAGGPIDDTIFPVRLEVDYARYYKTLP